jgi:three-Cys-motif partner protein
MYYVDLFAGSGINKTKKGKYYLIGSPFIATLNYRNKYDKFFFCETKKEYAKTLNDRLDSIKIQNKKVFSEDCNEALNDILLELSEVQNRHILFFIDPFSLEFKWESMIKVLALRSDIVFVFMTSQIVRAWKGALAQPEHLTKVLDTFYGDQSWKNAECEGDLLTIYKNKIQMARSECVLESVEIKGKGFHYEVLFITHKTKQDNPWLKGILKAKKEIEHNSDQAVKVTLEVISQKQADLGRFFK